jgi:UDP-glucuronate decarboxylase
MRVLVTGAASMVGARLCELVLDGGHHVIALDDLSSGTWANLAALERQQSFVFVEHDLSSPAQPVELSEAAEIDAVFHLAVPSSMRIVRRDPAGAAVTCVAATKHALELAIGRRFVMATSLELEGPGARCAELMAIELGGDVRIVRTPVTFGPAMDPDDRHPVAALVLRALAGERLDLESEDASRPLHVAWVDDVAHALARAMDEDACARRLLAPYHETTAGELGTMMADAATSPTRACAFRMPATRAPAEDGCVRASLVLGLPPSADLGDAIASTMTAFESRVGRRVARARSAYTWRATG